MLVTVLRTVGNKCCTAGMPAWGIWSLKDILSIDYSWGEIEFEVSPMNRLMKACAPAPAACEDAYYDMDIEPDYIEIADTVTVVWEIG